MVSFNLENIKRSVLRHKGPENERNRGKAELRAKYSSIRPTGVLLAGVIDDQKRNEWSNTVGYTNAARENTA